MKFEEDSTSRAQPSIRATPRSRHRLARAGQATVEFALVSIIFLTLVLGTIDLGRAVYMYSQLTNSVREGARYAQIAPTDDTTIKQRVIDYSPGLGLQTGDVTVSCSGDCKTGDNVTVSVSMDFSLVAQQFLGISPFTMHAHATDAID